MSTTRPILWYYCAAGVALEASAVAWAGGGGVRVVELETGHDPMVSAPQELTRLLVGCA